jgi:hypothetical protein
MWMLDVKGRGLGVVRVVWCGLEVLLLPIMMLLLLLLLLLLVVKSPEFCGVDFASGLVHSTKNTCHAAIRTGEKSFEVSEK